MPERADYLPGVPCWVDTNQPDPDAAAEFYGGLFGWEFENVIPEAVPGKYFLARIRGLEVGGIGSTPEGAPHAVDWNTYIRVENADETAAKVRDVGGAVIADPFDVADAGRMAINAYVAREAFGLLKRGIRINAILPGPTDTPLAQANADLWLGFGADYRAEVGTEPSTPLEQAYPLVFLCSEAASAVTGITMITDAGYVSSGITGSFPAATPAVEFLSGKF